jgi:hypothetical protein
MEILIALLLHIVVPLAGIGLYFWIARRWLVDGAPISAIAQLFLVFFCYGGLLLVILTAIFWKWSGAASLGAFLLLFASLPMTAIAILLHWRPMRHPCQRIIKRACAWYVPVLLVLILLGLAISG